MTTRMAITETTIGDEDMRHVKMLLMGGVLAANLLAGCSDSTTAPSNGGGGTPTPTPTPNPTPNPTPAPATAAVTVGDIFFTSGRNGSSNPAVDTVAVNGTVTWTWASTETLSHSIQSLGSPTFTSGAIQTGPSQTYHFMFMTPGTYDYNCGVHGNLMTGTIVVVAAAAGSPATTPPATPPPATPPPGY